MLPHSRVRAITLIMSNAVAAPKKTAANDEHEPRTAELRVGMSVFWVTVQPCGDGTDGWYRWECAGAVGLSRSRDHALKDARLVLAQRVREGRVTT